MNCEARKGFLTLSSCDNPAATACSNCGRSLCPTHLAPPGFTMCLDCAATSSNTDPNAPQGEDESDDVWAHRYRSSYYSSTGYTPGYGSRSSYYDDHDRSSFSDRDVDDVDDDTTGQSGFGDS
jgi:hypothetical protein